MIVGFVLPKTLAGSREGSICPARAPAFKPLQNRRQLSTRLKHYMDVVRHDYPGMQIIQPLNRFAIFKEALHHACYAGVREPYGAGFMLLPPESSGETPGHEEYCVVGNLVRQVPVVAEHVLSREPGRTLENDGLPHNRPVG